MSEFLTATLKLLGEYGAWALGWPIAGLLLWLLLKSWRERAEDLKAANRELAQANERLASNADKLTLMAGALEPRRRRS